MKKILFWDLSFHEKTGSSYFFSDLLSHEAELVRIWDSRWQTGDVTPLTSQLDGEYFDAAIFWQILPPIQEIMRLNCHTRVWVPMWDAFPHFERLPRIVIRAYLAVKLRILCFCRVLYNRLSQMGFTCFYIQYFPETPEDVAQSHQDISIFFWQRRQSLNWPLVKQLLGPIIPDRMIIRMALDLELQDQPPSDEDIATYHISVVQEWLPAASYFELLKSCNVFIAPRFREGIGMSFLEAMALGMCVLSPHEATANEYISDGVNGILYQADHPQPIQLENVHDIGQRARYGIREGRANWLCEVDNMLEFIFRNAK